jgi:peptidoglycan/LPS O-acetylase OafA/YrhL
MDPKMTPSKSSRFELLDPLRGVAILAVMALHFCERGAQSGDTLIHANIWPVVQHGYLGVQLFFVISGYCITAALYGAMNKPHPFRYFVRRRLRRIFPPYWASIVLVVVLGFATIAVLKTPREVVFPLTSFDWLCNVLLIQGPFHAPDANVVYWSLSIEMQFYLVMALALFWPRWTEAWLVGVSVVCLGMSHLTGWTLWGTVIAYWPEFICGIAVYYWLTGRMRYWWTPWLLVGLVLLDLGWLASEYSVWTQENGKFVKPVKILFCLGCMVTMLALRPYDERISKWRPIRTLSLVGLISYSLYLTHTPVGSRLINLADRLVGLDGLKWLASAAAATVVSLVFGWIFFRWFEKPWLNPVTSKPAGDESATIKTLAEGATT